MLTLGMAEFQSLVGNHLWVLFRVLSMFMVMPVYSGRYINRRIRVMLATVITLLVSQTVPFPAAVDFFSVASFLIIFQQITIGVAIGFMMRIPFEIMIVSGQIFARQAGLGFAMLVDPQSGVNVPIVSQIYMLMATMIFLFMDGHLMMLQMVVSSFHSMPIGADLFSREQLWQVISWGRWIFAGALSIALPGVISLLIVYISFGIMNKASPQLNVFALGFTVTILVGIFVMYLTVPMAMNHFEKYLTMGFENTSELLGGLH